MRYYRRENQHVRNEINCILYERFQEVHQTEEWKQQNRLDDWMDEEENSLDIDCYDDFEICSSCGIDSQFCGCNFEPTEEDIYDNYDWEPTCADYGGRLYPYQDVMKAKRIYSE